MTEPLNVQQMAQRLNVGRQHFDPVPQNPDGDTVGCGSALYYALKALDKNAAVLCSEHRSRPAMRLPMRTCSRASSSRKR